jgi:hypothetical protein
MIFIAFLHNSYVKPLEFFGAVQLLIKVCLFVGAPEKYYCAVFYICVVIFGGGQKAIMI